MRMEMRIARTRMMTERTARAERDKWRISAVV